MGAADGEPLDRAMPILPLRGTAPLPGLPLTVGVRTPSGRAAVRAADQAEPLVALLTQVTSESDEYRLSDFRPLGVLGALLRVEQDRAGGLLLLVEPRERIRALQLNRRGEAWFATVESVASRPAPDDVETAALVGTLKSIFRRHVESDPEGDPDQVRAVESIEDPGLLADVVVGRMGARAAERRAVLEQLDVRARLGDAVRLAGRAQAAAELARRMEDAVKGKLETAQRESLVRAQIELLRRELGEGRDARLGELKKRLADATLPPDLLAEAQTEVTRLEDAGPSAPERGAGLLRLEWLLALPWKPARRAVLDVALVRAGLERDHRGQREAKERILDALATGALRADGRLEPLLLLGPTGVGKSSLAHALGEALGRPVAHVRWGGVSGEADLFGERRHLPWARPGRVLEALRTAGATDPILVLDGIDQFVVEHPVEAETLLLALLDRDRVGRFEDRWLGVPVDLSRALVVATAQVAEVLPVDVRDRLIEIELRGYTDAEKRDIAVEHLIPDMLRETGLGPGSVRIPEPALQAIIEGWTFESGVRGLSINLRTLLRRLALRRASGEPGPFLVALRDLVHLLGPRLRQTERVEDSGLPGLALGLAWTPAGGRILYIEAAAVPGRGAVKLTGSLGEVMKESADAALTWLREHVPHLGDPNMLDLHVHVPEGAVPKDGPSAGVALLVAIASAIAKRPVRHDLAMSGEITLRGQVLAVGAIREKVMAAPRAGIKAVVLPRRNADDLSEVPREILAALEVHLVDRVEEVLALALGPDAMRPHRRARRKVARRGAAARRRPR